MKAEKDNKLTAKQLRFASEYCLDLNCTQAAIRAGYSEKTAYSIGSRLLKLVEVQNKISELQSDLEATTGLTKIRILNAFKEIAFSNIARFHNTWIERKEFDVIPENEKACIQEISTKVIKTNVGPKEAPIIADVEYIKIKLYDRSQALSKISELLGFNSAEKLDLKIDVDSLSDEQLDRLLDRYMKKALNTSGRGQS